MLFKPDAGFIPFAVYTQYEQIAGRSRLPSIVYTRHWLHTHFFKGRPVEFARDPDTGNLRIYAYERDNGKLYDVIEFGFEKYNMERLMDFYRINGLTR